MCQSLKVEMEKFLIKKKEDYRESTDIRTVPGKIKLVYSGLPDNGIRVRRQSKIMTAMNKKNPLYISQQIKKLLPGTALEFFSSNIWENYYHTVCGGA